MTISIVRGLNVAAMDIKERGLQGKAVVNLSLVIDPSPYVIATGKILCGTGTVSPDLTRGLYIRTGNSMMLPLPL
jgi:hypothetical protein